jgi:hypothetical protein
MPGIQSPAFLSTLPYRTDTWTAAVCSLELIGFSSSVTFLAVACPGPAGLLHNLCAMDSRWQLLTVRLPKVDTATKAALGSLHGSNSGLNLLSISSSAGLEL